MNNEHHENGALRSPLIFTVPAYPFVVALYFNWLDEANRARVPAQTLAHRLLGRGPHDSAAEAGQLRCYFPRNSLTRRLDRTKF
jgi:hypothetical protein